jgi:tetratricopeptide (TPR) repeat protein
VEVHRRLLAVYREDKSASEAAEQCLLLAALFHKSGNKAESSKFLSEAASMDPGLDKENLDLVEFARDHGIELESPRERMSSSMADPRGNIEIDLSEDLSEIFFKGNEEGTASAGHEPSTAADSEAVSEEYSTETPLPAAVESFQEQLQEVDFYLSLGFYEEARSKLDQIARLHANSPEVSLRYQQIGDKGVRSADVGAASVPDGVGELEIIPSIDFEAAVSDQAAGIPQAQQPASVAPEQPAQQSISGSKPGINEMFADLINEVNAPTAQETAREEFESHFNLGIAYRESDLLDEAIQEFQCAVKPLNPAKFPREVIRCCGMLSTCYLDKKMARSAIRWCQTGLDVPGISPHETLALQYDMSIAYTLAGNSEDALKCLGYICG